MRPTIAVHADGAAVVEQRMRKSHKTNYYSTRGTARVKGSQRTVSATCVCSVPEAFNDGQNALS